MLRRAATNGADEAFTGGWDRVTLAQRLSAASGNCRMAKKACPMLRVILQRILSMLAGIWSKAIRYILMAVVYLK